MINFKSKFLNHINTSSYSYYCRSLLFSSFKSSFTSPSSTSVIKFNQKQQQQQQQQIKPSYYSTLSSNNNIVNNKMSSSFSNDRASRMIWVDLEMTGLDLSKDHIMEMACIITDSDLNVIEVGPELIIHISDADLNSMGEWCTQHHGQSGLTAKCRESNMTIEEADRVMTEFLNKHVEKGQCPLAGNSVHCDLRFLLKEMPRFAEMLHYRIVDVSTIKELARRWYPDPAGGVKKRNLHRTLADIEDSINELKHYRSTIFKQ